MGGYVERRAIIMKAFILILACLFAAAVLAPPTFAAEKTVSNKPIKITSDRLEADNNARIIHFRGSVHAVQEDIDIICDVLSVTYGEEKQGTSGQNVEHIVAEGNVIITQQKRKITGKKAEFFQNTRTIVITGNPVAQEGQNIIQGSKIVFYIDENKSVIEGAQSKQVEAVIYPGKNGG
jgi:lipopolysaccharide export system protein LptA